MRDDRGEAGEAYTGPTVQMRRPQLRPPPGRAPRVPHRADWRWLRAAALVGAGILGLLLIAAYLQVRGLAEATVVRDARPGHFTVSPAAPFTVLVIGVDERAGHPEEGVRGDSLLVLHVDPAGRWASLLSIPRDSVVQIPGVGPAKVNAAYGQGYAAPEQFYGAGVTPHEGGMALAAQSVEQFLGTPVDYTAQVNFDGFARIIDALGGVTIDVPRHIVDDEYPTEDFGTTRVEFQPGPQLMDGQRALTYARTRHADSDFGRAERQQQVVRAVVSALKARGPAGAALLLPALRASLGGAVATTLPFDRPDSLAALAWLAGGLDEGSLVRLQLSPATAGLREEGSDLVWDQADVQALARRMLARPSVASEAARVQVLNGAGVAGLAGRVTGQLAGKGFTVIPAGDAGREDVAKTVVYDARGKPATARALADQLRAELREGAPEGAAPDADVVVVLGADAAR